MIRRISLRNLKSYGEEPQTFEIRPITLLLGSNGAGKSTLFQALLALKQSWSDAGVTLLRTDGPLISMGAFWNVVHNQPDGAVEVGLRIEDDSLGVLDLAWERARSDTEKAKEGEHGVLTRVGVGHDGLILVPRPTDKEDDRFEFDPPSLRPLLAASPALAPLLDRDAGISAGIYLTRAPGGESKVACEAHLVDGHLAGGARLADLTAEWSRIESDEKPGGIRGQLEIVGQRIWGDWTAFLNEGLQYTGPLRHPGARVAMVNRTRHLSLGQQGEHLGEAMAQSKPLLDRTNDLARRMDLPYRLDVRDLAGSTGRAVELVMESRAGGPAVGFPDVGFGIRQVFPVLAARALADMRLDDRISRGDRSAQVMVLVEQPELHLHPGLQADLMEVLLSGLLDGGASQKAERRVPALILETHSEHMIYRIQRLVYDRRINREDVSILSIEQEEGKSRVRRIRLRPDGLFADPWPRGFFIEREMEVE